MLDPHRLLHAMLFIKCPHVGVEEQGSNTVYVSKTNAADIKVF